MTKYIPVNYQTAESIILTRMHSSRMRTVRCSGHPGGVYPSVHWGVCIPACTGGCVSQHDWAGVCVSQHALGRARLYPSTHWAGGCLPRGVCLPGGVYLEGCLLRGVSATHPCEQNDWHPWKCNLASTTMRMVKMESRVCLSHLNW